MLSGFRKNLVLDIIHQIRAVPGEQLDGVLRGFIGAEQAVFFITAASIYRGCKNIIQTAYHLGAALLQDPLSARSRMDITVEYILCII